MNACFKPLLASFMVLGLAACGADTHTDTDHDDHAGDTHKETGDDHHDDGEHETHAANDHHESHNDHQDHENHDHEAHAGGEAHVHGAADFAAALDGNTLNLTLDAPIANFDLQEGGDGDYVRKLGDLSALATPQGGECLLNSYDKNVRTSGDHSNAEISWDFTCNAPQSIEAITLNVFEAFSGFEHVDAVWVSDTDQIAVELDAASPVLTISQ